MHKEFKIFITPGVPDREAVIINSVRLCIMC